MENGEEGCTSPTATAADSEFAIRGGNSMPKIPDAADKIEALVRRSATWRSC